MKALIKAVRKIQFCANVLVAVSLAAMMCVILLQTFTRYVIFHSLPWSEELSRYLFVAMVLLGLNIGISGDMMIRIDLIDTRLPQGARRVLEVIRQLVALFVSVMFFISTFDLIRIGRFQKSAAMQIPMHMMYMVLTIGFLLAIVAVLIKLYETVTGRDAGGEEE